MYSIRVCKSHHLVILWLSYINVFIYYNLSTASNSSHVKCRNSPIAVGHEVKVIYKPIVNESHPVVRQLVEEEYDLDASIEAVRLFGTLEKAMDYLAKKETESGDDEVQPSIATVAPTTDDR